MRRLGFACLLTMSATVAVAAPGGDNSEYTLATGAGADYGLDVSAERQHQQFDGSSADIDTLSLQPWLQIDNWNFTLDLPWQRAEGEFFVVGSVQPSLKNICQVPSTFLQRYPRLARYAGSACAPGTAASGSREESGIGDVTAFAHYSVPLDERGIWLGSLGGGYKADSGDLEKGLGSGTREAMFEGVLGAGYGRFSANAVAGYAWIVGGEAEEGTSDYVYGALDLSVKMLHWLTLGLGWDYEQAYVPQGEDVRSLRGYVNFRPIDALRLQFYAKDYGDTLGYPEREYGGSAVWSF